MRFIPFGSGGGTNSANATFTLTVTASSGTVGVIGTGVTVACHPTMITTSNGTLLLATGFDPIKRLRPNEKRLTPAGVPAPRKPLRILTQEEIAGDGTAQIPQDPYRYIKYDYSEFGTIAGKWEGTTFQYTAQGQRSADKRHQDYILLRNSLGTGESVELVSSWGRTGAISTFLGVRPSTFVTPTGTTGLPYEWGLMRFLVRIGNPNSTSNPDLGSPLAYSGRYQAFVRFVDKDGLVSNPSPISSDVVLLNAPYFLYRDVEVPSDPRVARRQIFRNFNGNKDAYFLDIDTDDLTSTDLVSYLTDEQLILNFGQYLEDENGYNLFYLYGEPPNDKPFIAEYKTCIFAAGRRVYRQGNVSVTNGSTTISGIGTRWRRAFIGRKIVIGTRQYPILDVDEAAQTLETTEQYDGPTDAYEVYSIEPYYAEGNLLGYTEPGYPESWLPIEQWLSMNEDGDDVTGLMVFANAMWILKERSILQFSFTTHPGRDGDLQPASSRGCINQRMAILVQNQCLMMDRLGVHVFNGAMPRAQYQSNTTPDHLSLPIADLFRAEGDGLRINFEADKCFWHGVHCLELHLARWYVTMHGYELPQHSVTYDYLMDRWSVEEYPFPITSSCVGTQLLGRPLLGGPGGRVYQPDIGSLDVVSSGATRVGVSDVLSPYKIVLDDVPPACVGVPIAIVSGQGRGLWRTVLAQDDTTIEVDLPFTTLPNDESVVQIGAIPWEIVTPKYDKTPYGVSSPQGLRIQYNRTADELEGYVRINENDRDDRSVAASSAWGSYSSDVKDPYVRKIDFNSKAGMVDINMDSAREHDVPEEYSLYATINGFSGQQKPVITSISVFGAAPLAVQ